MEYKEAKEILLYHKRWLDGEEIEQLDPIEVSRAMIEFLTSIDINNRVTINGEDLMLTMNRNKR